VPESQDPVTVRVFVKESWENSSSVKNCTKLLQVEDDHLTKVHLLQRLGREMPFLGQEEPKGTNNVKVQSMHAVDENPPPIAFHGMFPQSQQDFDEAGEVGPSVDENENFFQSNEEEERTIKLALNAKIDELKGFEQKICTKLRKLVLEKWNAFCDRDSQCSMSKFTPMKVELDESQYFRVPKAMNLSPKESLALKRHLKKMETLGILRKVKNPTYGARSFVVPKKKADTWRVVTDMRQINKRAKLSALQMPNLEKQMN